MDDLTEIPSENTEMELEILCMVPNYDLTYYLPLSPYQRALEVLDKVHDKVTEGDNKSNNTSQSTLIHHHFCDLRCQII